MNSSPGAHTGQQNNVTTLQALRNFPTFPRLFVVLLPMSTMYFSVLTAHYKFHRKNVQNNLTSKKTDLKGRYKAQNSQLNTNVTQLKAFAHKIFSATFCKFFDRCQVPDISSLFLETIRCHKHGTSGRAMIIGCASFHHHRPGTADHT